MRLEPEDSKMLHIRDVLFGFESIEQVIHIFDGDRDSSAMFEETPVG